MPTGAETNHFDKIEAHVRSVPEVVAGVLATARAFDDKFWQAQEDATRVMAREKGNAWSSEVEFPGLSIFLEENTTYLTGEALKRAAETGGQYPEKPDLSYVTDENSGDDEGKWLYRTAKKFYGRDDFLADWALDLARYIDLLSEAGWPMRCAISVSNDELYVSGSPQAEANGPDTIPDALAVDLEAITAEVRSDYDDDDYQLKDEELREHVDERVVDRSVRISPRVIIAEGCASADIIRLRELLTAKQAAATSQEPETESA